MLKIYLKYIGLTLLTLCALGFMLLLVHPVQRQSIRSDIRELNIGLSQEMRWNIQLGWYWSYLQYAKWKELPPLAQTGTMTLMPGEGFSLTQKTQLSMKDLRLSQISSLSGLRVEHRFSPRGYPNFFSHNQVPLPIRLTGEASCLDIIHIGFLVQPSTCASYVINGWRGQEEEVTMRVENVGDEPISFELEWL